MSTQSTEVKRALSVAGFAVARFELIQLRIALRHELPLRGFAVKVGSWAIVEGGVQINPNLGIRIPALVFLGRGRFGKAQALAFHTGLAIGNDPAGREGGDHFRSRTCDPG